MAVRTRTAFGAAVALCLAAASAAQAADPEFCRDYARSAVRQFHAALRHDECRRWTLDANVWSDDWEHHYGWCLHVSRDAATAGRKQRHDLLVSCRGDGWQPPSPWSH